DDSKSGAQMRSSLDNLEGAIDVRRECAVARRIVVRRKDGDRSSRSDRAQTEQSGEDRRSGSAVLRLDHHALRGDVPKQWSVEALVATHDDGEGSLRREQPHGTLSGLLQQRRITEQPAELLRALIPRDPAGERPKPRTVSACENDPTL